MNTLKKIGIFLLALGFSAPLVLASYSTPLAWSSITATPTTLAGYGITDGLAPTSQGVAQTVTVHITSAQVLTLSGTPIQIVAAQGSGKTIQLVGLPLVKFTSGGTPYSVNTTLTLTFVSASTFGYSNTTSLISSGNTLLMFGANTTAANSSIASNAAINLSVLGGNPTLGNGSLDVIITYVVINL